VLNQDQVRSSIARHLGIDIAALPPVDRHVEGVVEMMMDATSRFSEPLTQERLFDWHAAVFPTGRSGLTKIKVGYWRDDSKGPMQVVSGPVGREKVHFEAPAAAKLVPEMEAFIDGFNIVDTVDPVIKAGLVHLWFVTIHPFDDGNGRIARALTDMALARSENSPQRFYSMSAEIQRQRNTYYTMLERTQKGNLDVSPWLEWFLTCLSQAIDRSEETLASILFKATFWQKRANETLNNRQRLVLNRLIDGFEGHLTTSKWAKLANTSQDTAYRDILDLVERGIFVRDPKGGRSTSYSLKALE